MPSVAQVQQWIDPLFPGLMGVRIVEATPERVVGEMLVRPELCTAGGRFVASADRRRGQLCTVGNPPAVHL